MCKKRLSEIWNFSPIYYTPPREGFLIYVTVTEFHTRRVPVPELPVASSACEIRQPKWSKNSNVNTFQPKYSLQPTSQESRARECAKIGENAAQLILESCRVYSTAWRRAGCVAFKLFSRPLTSTQEAARDVLSKFMAVTFLFQSGRILQTSNEWHLMR